MRVIKQYENENYNPVYIIETGEKRKSYYKFVTYRGNVLRQNETIYKFVYTKRNFLITYNEYRDFKSEIGNGFMVVCIERIYQANLLLELIQD